jgi:hypothetical protein
MVFCKECGQKVEDCPHFVYPLEAPRVSVFDPKIETLAYDQAQRILEIRFKSGQVWQLVGIPANIYSELRDTSISSFLKFIARRYRVVPVKTGLYAIRLPESEPCKLCQKPMSLDRRINNEYDASVRVLWKCEPCDRHEWRQYGQSLQRRERRGVRWH